MKRIEIMTVGLMSLAMAAHASSGNVGFGQGQSLDPQNALSASKELQDVPGINAGPIKGSDPKAGDPALIKWIRVEGTDSKQDDELGRCPGAPGAKKGFCLGANGDYSDEKPVHRVAIKTFQMMQAPVTVEQYRECVNRNQCSEPDMDLDSESRTFCNWGKTDRDRSKDPINCIDWARANQYAKFAGNGARLPSEAEWEYAARSEGKEQKYPWGNDDPSQKTTVGNGDGTMPVCSSPARNGKVSGGELCDMVGNVWQWMQDTAYDYADHAPMDGTAYDLGGWASRRMLRGGSFGSSPDEVSSGDTQGKAALLHDLQVSNRYSDYSDNRNVAYGFRLAR